MIYRLIVLNGPAKGQHITVDPEPVTIGRDESCDIVLPDSEMALKHARLEQREDDLFIADLGSMHKILLNKHETLNARLKHGDIIELGRTRLLLQAVVRAEVNSAQPEPEALKRRGRKRRLALAASLLLIAGGTFAIINSENAAPSPDLTAQPQIPEPIAPDPVPVPEIASAVQENPEPAAAEEPIDEELRRIREDLSSIQEHIQKLNTTSSMIGEAAATPALPAVDDVEAAMKAAQDAMASENFDQAQLILEHLQLEKPDYLPAYELRAAMYEKLGMPAKARDQWTSILQRTAESELYRKAVTERIRLGRSDSQSSINAHDAVRIQSLEQARFRENSEYDEMRSIKVQLSYNRQLGPIDPNAVRLVLYFFEQDLDTQEIQLSKAQPYSQASLQSWREDAGNLFACTVNYVVPRGYYAKDHNSSRQRYYGFIARLHYFDQLVDEQARPSKLLDPAIMEAAGLAMQTAGTLSPEITTPSASN